MVCCKMGINKIGEGWWERERGASGGDRAGEVVGVVVEASASTMLPCCGQELRT